MLSKEALRYIRELELKTRRNVTSIFSGRYRSAFRGRGMEFSDLRQYEFGDDVRNIHWSVTARTGFPHVKLFDEERELHLMIMVDISASGSFGSIARTKNETAAEIAAFLAAAAGVQNDNTGLILFTDSVEHFVPPKKGRTHVLRIIRDILNFTPHSNGTSIDTAMRFCSKVMKKKGIVFVVSDFIDSGFEKNLGALAKKHDVISVLTVDERESQLPDVGRVMVEDAESGELREIDTSNPALREEMARKSEERFERIERNLKKYGSDVLRLSTAESCYRPLIRFFNRRERKRSHA